MARTDLVARIYEAAADPALWPAILTDVADHLGATGGMLAYVHPERRNALFLTGRLRDDLSTLFLGRHVNNVWTRATATVPRGTPVDLGRLVERRDLMRTEFYADVLAPQDVDNILNVTDAAFGRFGGFGGFGFTLHKRDSDVTRERLRRFQRLMPHLSRALETAIRIGEHADGTRQLARALQLMPGPALLLDVSGRVVHANQEAEALLRENDGLGTGAEDGLRLAAALPGETAALTRAAAEALSVAMGGGDTLRPPLQLTRPSGRPPLMVMFVPLPPPAFALWELTEGARAMVLVIDLAREAMAAVQNAATTFGLTPTEARVAALIAHGHSGPQAAAALGIALATVKTHLGRIYEKTGIRSQQGLARLLGALPSGMSHFPTRK